MKELFSQQTGTVRTTEHTVKGRFVRSLQHLPPQSLGGQYRATAVCITLTLNRSHTQNPEGIIKKGPPDESQRSCRRIISQTTKVPHDGPAEVPVRFYASKHKGVTGAQVACMRSVLAPVTI
jgi:hypothetical protein